MLQILAKKLKNLPSKPGVYVFKDARGSVLYVGKAINLKNRVSSYFARSSDRASGRMTGRIQLMISQIKYLDYTVTDNEAESLILENNFIKQLKPKYNVMLRDDKNYLFLKISAEGGTTSGGNNSIPTIEFVHQQTDKNACHFGPYTSSTNIKDTLRLMRKIFPYCANAKISSKPCFYYHIGKCPGVCIGKISLTDYRDNYIKKIMQFLAGHQDELARELKKQMAKLARCKQFEQAAVIRNQLFALNRVLQRQKVVYPKKISQDVFAVFKNGSACINLFIIRDGKLIRKENFILDNAKNATAEEILDEFLPRYYAETADWPKEIVLPVSVEGAPPHLKIIIPSRGDKLALIKLGAENARQYLESQSDQPLLEEARLLASLKELQRVLKLPKLPGRIEAYDISNIQGTSAVGSMVVFDFARAKKSDYRKFKIRAKSTPDDFAMMKEILERRFKHSTIPSGTRNPFSEGSLPAGRDGKNLWPLPDLILIDGGKGQLNAALSALQNSNIKYQISESIPIIGLAKRLEEIFIPGKKTPLILPKNSIALFLLQRIRDEAHRFAITYHRHLRSRQALSST